MLPRYSGFPPEIFEDGLVPQMQNTAFRLYIFLCRSSDRKSSLQFAVFDKEICQQTGSSPRALCSARNELKRFGLISCDRDPGGSYTYSLCDVKTRRPFPGDQKIRPRYTKKEKVFEQPVSVLGTATNNSALGEAPSAREQSGDTSFEFGHNARREQKLMCQPTGVSSGKFCRSYRQDLRAFR